MPNMTSRQIRRAAARHAAQEVHEITAPSNHVPLTSAFSDDPARAAMFREITTELDREDREPHAFDRQPRPAVQPLRTGPTGPRTPEGKARSSQNNFKHGLTGAFCVLDSEEQDLFDASLDALIAEHQPATPTESELVRRMAEHAWLSRRAQIAQDATLFEDNHQRFALYLRYQTTNDRGFRACLNQLLALRREARQAAQQLQSQKAKAQETVARVRLANARAAALELQNQRKKSAQPVPQSASERCEITLEAPKVSEREHPVAA